MLQMRCVDGRGKRRARPTAHAPFLLWPLLWQTILDVHFPLVVYKKLLGRQCTFQARAAGPGQSGSRQWCAGRS